MNEEDLGSPTPTALEPLGSLLTPREVRVTLDPVASAIFVFHRGPAAPGVGHYRRVVMRAVDAQLDEDALGSVRCALGGYYYYGTVQWWVGGGPHAGNLRFEGVVATIQQGDEIGFRYVTDDVVGGRIRVEIYTDGWKTVLHEPITQSYNKVALQI